MLQTGGTLDMSISGQGFFQITMPDGTLAYTRDGSFSLDYQGNVVTASGYPISPAITIPATAQSVTVGVGRHRVRDHGGRRQGRPPSARSSSRISSTRRVCSRPATTC